MKIKLDYEFELGDDTVIEIEYEYEPTAEDAVDYICYENDMNLSGEAYYGAVDFAKAYGMDELFQTKEFKDFIHESISDDVKEKAIIGLKKRLEAK